MTTRERKIKFIHDYGRGVLSRHSLDKAVSAALREYGQSWLTDDQLDDLVEMQIRNARFDVHMKIRNRKRRASA